MEKEKNRLDLKTKSPAIAATTNLLTMSGRTKIQVNLAPPAPPSGARGPPRPPAAGARGPPRPPPPGARGPPRPPTARPPAPKPRTSNLAAAPQLSLADQLALQATKLKKAGSL